MKYLFLSLRRGRRNMNKIVLGTDIFDKLIENGGYYVDKTELIYELVEEATNEVTLFTRPRRFGKTLIMSMMESFFDIQRDSSKVFSDMNIMKNHPEFCSKWMNQYPMLFVSFKDVEGMNYQDALESLSLCISRICKKNEKLLASDNINPEDAVLFKRLMAQNGSVTDIKGSLDVIMRMMKAVYSKPVILLIDEYDVPLAKAEASKNKDYYMQMLDVIRGIMSISLKTNEYLKFAVVTGCLRISKESIFTGVNNFVCYSVTSRRFSQYFGFTQEEVAKMLASFGLSEKMDLIKKWYDGYVFGSTEVFCPWDVVSYIAAILYDEEEEPQNFWSNTSSNAILDDFVNQSRFDVSEKFETLLNGGEITEDVCEELTYDSIAESEKNFWSVMLMTGYVSKSDKSVTKGRVKLRIPNAEIACIFRDAVVERFRRTLDAGDVDSFITAMWNKDEKTASEMLTSILWNSISYFDYGEDYYHGMLNGIFTSRGFSPDSNDEAGLGRLDLRIKDRSKRNIILMEFKRSKNEKDLDVDCDEAIKQILDNGYNKVIPEGYENQLVYGIAFYAKKARIKLMK